MNKTAIVERTKETLLVAGDNGKVKAVTAVKNGNGGQINGKVRGRKTRFDMAAK